MITVVVYTEREHKAGVDAAGNKSGGDIDYDMLSIDCQTWAQCEEVRERYWADEDVKYIAFVQEGPRDKAGNRSYETVYGAGPGRDIYEFSLRESEERNDREAAEYDALAYRQAERRRLY